MLIFKPGTPSQDESFGAGTIAPHLAAWPTWRGSVVAYLSRKLARDVPVPRIAGLHGQRPASCLVGLSSGHPTLPGNGRVIVTSDLVLMSERRQLGQKTRSPMVSAWPPEEGRGPGMVGLSTTPTREEGSRGPCGYDGATPLLHDRLDQAQQTRMDGMNGIDGGARDRHGGGER